MAVKVTQKQPHAHLILTKKGNITLQPGDTYVPDELWAEAKAGSHHFARGKKVNTLDALVKAGHLEVTEGASDPNEASEGSSAVTRGEVPLAYHGGLPGQAGEDMSKRDEAEAPAGDEPTDDGTGQRRRARRG